MPIPKIDPRVLESLDAYHRETIPEDYLDLMGHMNVRWYVGLFSKAVEGLFVSVGMDAAHFDGVNGTFALMQHIVYRAEVHAGQDVVIRTRVLGRSEKRLHILHFMINETTGALAATMEVLITHADLTRRRSSAFPAAIARQIDTLLEVHRALPWEAPACGVIGV